MKLKTWHYVAGGAVAILGWNLFSRRAAAESLNFLLQRVEGISWLNGRPVIPVTISVQNTSNHQFTLYSFAGTVYVNNPDGTQYVIGDVSDFTQSVIAPNSQTDLTITIQLRLLGIVQDIISQINSGTFSNVIEFDTYANVDQLQVPVDYKFKLVA